MIDRPIAILGFGRSGTTWLSDIVSKTLGGLILFEPLHPQVCDFAAEVCYAPSSLANPSLALPDQRLADHWRRALGGEIRHRWLLRNHLLSPLEDVSAGFVDMVWEQCQVIGFKEIRANFMIERLIEQFDARIVFVVRHPCAVLASIRRRRNFWNEFGWERHWAMFCQRVLQGRPADGANLGARRQVIENARTPLEQQALMWGLSLSLAAAQLDRFGLPIFRYEDFYHRPFETTRSLLAYLGFPSTPIHPAHLFVPSMTTLRTMHGLVQSEQDMSDRGMDIFWEGLSEPEVQSVLAIARHFDYERWYGSGD